jgi:DNA-binding transcriptional LysR family regulator
VSLAQTAFTQILPEFFARYPSVRVLLHATNRRVDVLNESLDVAFRVRAQPTGEDGLVMRKFREVSELVVASPAYLDRVGRPERPEQLAGLETLGYDESENQTWELFDADCKASRVELKPRLVCHDFVLLKAAVLGGMGIALLPESVVRAELENRTLERVLPTWNLPRGIFHVVFPTRRGLLPAVRAFIDFAAERLPELI